MKNKRILSYAVIILLAVYFYNSETQANTSTQPIFHPFCMEEFVNSDWNAPFDMNECASRHTTEELTQNDFTTKPSYTVHRYQSAEEGGRYLGFVQYTIAAQKKNLYDIEYMINGR